MLELTNVNKIFKNGKRQSHILHDINLKVNKNDFLAIMGPSGAGKSTLLNIIGLLDKNFTGQYMFDGIEVNNLLPEKQNRFRNSNVGFVFQNFKLISQITVKDNIMLPLIYSHIEEKKAIDEVKRSLDSVNLSPYLKSYPSDLSGGQKQRVAIARALIMKPKLLIADEPTGALDSNTSKQILQLFIDLNKSANVTIVMVTHDAEIAKLANRTVHVVDGKIT